MSNTTAWGLGCASAALGVGLTAVAAVVGANDLSYRNEGVDVSATVTESWSTATKSSSRPHSKYVFQVTGKNYTGTGGDHQQGEKIPIQYLATDPSVNRESGTHWAGFPVLGFVVGILLVFFGRALMRRSRN